MIVGSYTDDYDIIYLNDTILSHFLQEKNKLPELSIQLTKLKKLVAKPQTLNAKKETIDEIERIEEKIKDIKQDTKLKCYKQETEVLLQQYKQLKFSFVLSPEKIIDRLKIIEDFIKCAKQYIDIRITRNNNNQHCCPNCGASNDDLTKCPECHYEYQIIHVIKHIDKIHLNPDNDIENFIKALMRYQGLQNNPPSIIYSKLDLYFKERGLPSSKEIKALPLNGRGKKGNTNKEMLYAALAHIGYANYYEDVNLIGHVYWDWLLYDLTPYKDTILRHYMITQKSFYSIPIEIRGRISSLGTQYRLWRHLQLIGHQCYQDDFKIAENVDSLQNHHRLWKMMCDYANDTEIYYID